MMMPWSLRIALLAGVWVLAGCGGSGDPPAPRESEQRAAVPLLSEVYFDYELIRDGAAPITETGTETVSCPDGGCVVRDLRLLSGSPGTGMRAGFDTVTGRTGQVTVRETVAGVAVTAGEAPFTRYGFWAGHGYAALEVGAGGLSVEIDRGPSPWSGTFRTAQAWTGGEASGTNPAGTGSATWRGIAEAAVTATFERVQGTVEVSIADLSRPRVDVAVDLDGAGRPLGWTGIQPRDGRFVSGAAGSDYLAGRFHGPGHEEAWGVFDTGVHVGAFGARR